MNKKLRIIIVDDHFIVRLGLKTLLSQVENVEVVGEAMNGLEFLAMLNYTSADIVIMNVNMPTMDGIEATKQCLSQYPNIKIIGFSGNCVAENINKMIEAGVEGFISKSAGENEIKKAIYLIASGKNYFSEDLMRILAKNFGLSAEKTTKKLDKNNPFNLTQREFEVLQLIAKGYSNQEIGNKLNISQRTVDGHRAKLLSKTNTRNTSNLILFAVQNNLIDLEIE